MGESSRAAHEDVEVPVEEVIGAEVCVLGKLVEGEVRIGGRG